MGTVVLNQFQEAPQSMRCGELLRATGLAMS